MSKRSSQKAKEEVQVQRAATGQSQMSQQAKAEEIKAVEALDCAKS